MPRTLRLTAVIWREGRQYVSSCPELGVASFGRTPAAAKASLKEAAELWLSNARKLGILDDVRPALEDRERYSSSLEVSV